MHAVYASEFLGYPQKIVAQIFAKSESTISNWVSEFRSGNMERSRVGAPTRVTDERKDWVLNLVKSDPQLFLREISAAFLKAFKFSISSSTVYTILNEANFTKRVLEHRAMEISYEEITRFTFDMNLIHPLQEQLVFLDEMSTDNRAMLRKKGWFLRGTKPIVKNLFRRGTRLSVLSFLGVKGIIENFQTTGTFNRDLFFQCIKSLLDSGKVQKFPGRNSVFVLDGASIHLDANMIEYMQSRGVLVVFLPTYAPFYNPIEIVFGLMKRRCRELYDPSAYGSEQMVLMNVLHEFQHYDCSEIFKHCGYNRSGEFNPHTNNDFFMLNFLIGPLTFFHFISETPLILFH
eukprot:Pompholyxophrys_sp_v1_NODE_10_length_5661_cov_6.324474.p1 type:complete len:346 gc:universal NODE_10_length_5661_cov_6.324474:5570-4533(-)